jgi:hypothetical protein
MNIGAISAEIYKICGEILDSRKFAYQGEEGMAEVDGKPLEFESTTEEIDEDEDDEEDDGDYVPDEGDSDWADEVNYFAEPLGV